jgi:alkanesulfonate monooxygenase SsuD/methylene tetrahydromethanopterin reductase-like flavin-dependent oxidoreductase (luciferase family)
MAKTKMQFGVITLNKGPHSSAANLAQYATRAEALGFDFIAVNDHLVFPHTDPEGHADKHWTLNHNYFEALQSCLYIAGMTSASASAPACWCCPTARRSSRPR